MNNWIIGAIIWIALSIIVGLVFSAFARASRERE